MKHPILAALVLLVCAAPRGAGTELQTSAANGDDPVAHACRRDQSGIAWTLPFEVARARAEAEQRLLFIKPIAFGTSSDGGW